MEGLTENFKYKRKFFNENFYGCYIYTSSLKSDKTYNFLRSGTC